MAATPDEPHIMIGGDHSTNFGHFTALANNLPDEDLCLIYIDAHLDIHTPESSRAQASGAPHGTNVRALLGDGDARWLSLQTHRPALRPENIFYLGTRSFENAEIEFARSQNIYMRSPTDLQSPTDWARAAREIRQSIGTRCHLILTRLIPPHFATYWCLKRAAFHQTRPNILYAHLRPTPTVLNLWNTHHLVTVPVQNWSTNWLALHWTHYPTNHAPPRTVNYACKYFAPNHR